MKRISIIAAALMMLVACVSRKGPENFTTYELSIIEGADSIMRVLTVRDSADLAIL